MPLQMLEPELPRPSLMKGHLFFELLNQPFYHTRSTADFNQLVENRKAYLTLLLNPVGHSYIPHPGRGAE
jgi:hypothetical protein